MYYVYNIYIYIIYIYYIYIIYGEKEREIYNIYIYIIYIYIEQASLSTAAPVFRIFGVFVLSSVAHKTI